MECGFDGGPVCRGSFSGVPRPACDLPVDVLDPLAAPGPPLVPLLGVCFQVCRCPCCSCISAVLISIWQCRRHSICKYRRSVHVLPAASIFNFLCVDPKGQFIRSMLCCKVGCCFWSPHPQSHTHTTGSDVWAHILWGLVHACCACRHVGMGRSCDWSPQCRSLRTGQQLMQVEQPSSLRAWSVAERSRNRALSLHRLVKKGLSSSVKHACHAEEWIRSPACPLHSLADR